MASLLLLAACSERPVHSADSRYSLTFSDDTLAFDTVFTGVGTATWGFLAYNENDVTLGLDARMAGGASSPFRMNIDGQAGSVITDLEIAANDSMYCFVSVTVDPKDSDSPLLVEDSILFILESGNVQSVLLQAYGQDVRVLHSATIEADAAFDCARPYLIYDTLRVAQGAVLSIGPGTNLYFHKGAGLKVSGTVLAEGTADSVIHFRGDRTDNVLTNLAYDNVPGRWTGIDIDSCSFGNVFDHCDIHGAKHGIVADTSSLAATKMVLSNSVIHNVEEDCLSLAASEVYVWNCQLTNAGGHCVSLKGGSSQFLFCTIANFYPWAEKAEAVSICNTDGKTVIPMLQAEFRNCIITGRSDDELTGLMADTIQGISSKEIANWSIANSLLLTKDTTDVHFSGLRFDKAGAANFRRIHGDDYTYDFSLDSLSQARGLADEASVLIPFDILGNERPATGADAGCYQYIPDSSEK